MKIGIDLGGTSAKVALVSEHKKIVRQESLPTYRGVSPAQLGRDLAHVINNLVGNKQISKIGVGVAGDIDYKKGVVRISPNLGWKNVPLKKILEKETRADVVVDNDANVAAWGVYQTQVSPSVKNVVVFTLGTGVGGGLIINGILHRGATGSAGEIGHMILVQNGRMCNCGLQGCLEAYVGAVYIVKEAQRRLAQGEKSILTKLYKRNPIDLTARALSDAARNGDLFSLRIWNEVGAMLGIACGNLIYTLNPEMIFLCGGVAQSKNLLLTPLKKQLAARPFRTPVRAAQIRIAADTSQIGVIGASLI